MCGLFLGYLPRLRNNQTRRKWSPELRIFAGVQRKSCSKKWKRILGLGPNVRRRLTKNSGDAGLHYFSVISLNRRNNPAWQKVFAKVENFRRSTTWKLLEKMKKKFGSWSQRAQTLNEKLRRCKAALFLRLSPNRRNNPTWRKKFARVENFRRSTTRELLEKMKKKIWVLVPLRRDA